MTEGLALVLSRAAEWLLTYLLHSTLLLGLVLALSYALRQRALWLQEGLLRGALLGGVLSAALLPLTLPGEPRPAAVSSRVETIPLRPARPVGQHVRPPASGLSAPLVPAPRDEGSSRALVLRAGAWPRHLVLASLTLTLALLASYLGAWRRLRRLLADRTPVRDPEVRALLAPLVAAVRLGGVRISASARIAVPLALGTRRPEICLPERALTGLPLDELRGILGHEVAHLLRRDPAFRIGVRVIADLLPLQPLNRLVGRRLAELAEYACDDFSAERTGRPLALARSLTEVAGWLLGGRGAEQVPGALRTESELGSRVRRLIAWEKRSEPMAKTAYVLGLSSALLVGVVCCAPRVMVARAEPVPPSPSMAAPAAPTREAERAGPPHASDEQLEQLASELREAVRAAVPTAGQRKELNKKAHELADAVRAGDAKRQARLERELAELSHKQADPSALAKVAQLQARLQARAAGVAREALRHAGIAGAQPDHAEWAEEVRGATKEALAASRDGVREAVREAMEQAREAAQEAREAAQEARERERELAEEAAEAEREAAEAARDAARDAARAGAEAARQRARHEAGRPFAVHPPHPPLPPRAPHPPMPPRAPAAPEPPEMPEMPDMPDPPQMPEPPEPPEPPASVGEAPAQLRQLRRELAAERQKLAAERAALEAARRELEAARRALGSRPAEQPKAKP